MAVCATFTRTGALPLRRWLIRRFWANIDRLTDATQETHDRSPTSDARSAGIIDATGRDSAAAGPATVDPATVDPAAAGTTQAATPGIATVRASPPCAPSRVGSRTGTRWGAPVAGVASARFASAGFASAGIVEGVAGIHAQDARRCAGQGIPMDGIGRRVAPDRRVAQLCVRSAQRWK